MRWFLIKAPALMFLFRYDIDAVTGISYVDTPPRLLSCSLDGRAKLWTSTGEPAGVFDIALAAANKVAALRDAKKLKAAALKEEQARALAAAATAAAGAISANSGVDVGGIDPLVQLQTDDITVTGDRTTFTGVTVAAVATAAAEVAVTASPAAPAPGSSGSGGAHGADGYSFPVDHEAIRERNRKFALGLLGRLRGISYWGGGFAWGA